MNPHSPDRVRVTISLSKEIADRIDELVDGVKVRNRSHAIETLVTDSLDIAQVRQAVILAGGEQAVDRIPAIKKMCDTLAQYGIFEAIVAVGFLGDEIKKGLGSGADHGIRIQYVESDLGTAGALLQLRNRLKRTFLVINIDEPAEINLKKLLKFHHEHGAIATIATQSLRELTGVYVMEPRVFNYIPQGFCMLEETVFHEMTKEGKLLPYPILNEENNS